MKRKTKKKGYALTAIICVLFIIIVAQFIFILNNKDVGTTESISKAETAKEIVLNKIETPIVDLSYNQEAVDNVKVKYTEEKPYKITFQADIGKNKDIELFSLYFDSDRGIFLGKIKDKESKMVKVSLEKNVFSTILGVSEEEAEKLYATQENLIDNIMSGISLKESSEETAKEELEQNCMKIKTPYTQLLYPKMWKKYLQVETDESSGEVKFYCQFSDKQKKELFTYTFGKASDILIGYLKDMEVGLSIGTEEADTSWTEEEVEIFYSMREDMNTIIDGLESTEGFVIERSADK